MRIITCASYHGTGSSAITDLLEEYDECFSMSEYEFRFIQDPEGISDLEYNLVQNHHRLNSGHALKRYKKKVDFLAGNKFIKKYEPFFNNKWKEYSYEYINKLTELKFKGYWHQDVIDKGNLYYLYKRTLNKILKKTLWKNKERSLIEMKNEITLCGYPTEKDFLRITREYINKLFNEANKEQKENIIVDQLVPPSNIDRYTRYFDDIKVVVVDRDPRDLYILSKYIWNEKVFPVENVEEFCKWYRYTRKHRVVEKYNEANTIFVQFEDLIYKYDETIKNIEQFLEFSGEMHKNKFGKFNPKKSIKNTRTWEKRQGVEREIKYIEKELSEYIYEF